MKNKRKRGGKLQRHMKKNKDNVISSFVQHNLLKADSSSSKGVQDFDRRLLPKIKIPSNDSNNTFAITPENWAQCL